MDSLIQPETSPDTQPGFRRWQIWLGFGLNLAFTLVVGLPLAVMFDNFWWLIWNGSAGLLFSGVVAIALLGTGNWFRGVLVALLHFATVAVIYLLGLAAELWLPPWPSLPHHASTYFFLWPLALVLAGTLRLLVGGRHKKFSQDRRFVFLHLIPILTALSVITLTTFRPFPRAISQSEWQQPGPIVDNTTLNEFLVTPLIADSEGGLWFAYKKLTGKGGVGHFTPNAGGQNRWQIYSAGSDNDGPEFDFVLSLLSDDHQGVWVGSLKEGLSHYQAQTDSWQMISALDSDVLAMTTLGGNLWLATFGDGVICYDNKSQQWEGYTQITTAGGLQDDEVTVLMADGAGGLWVGTYGGGVSHYDPARDAWQAFTVVSTDGGLGSNDVRALVVDETGNLWVGTFGGGISRYSPRFDSWDLYTIQTTRGNLASNYVLALLPGQNGELWAGLSNLRGQGGVGYFNGSDWQSHTATSTEGGLLSNDIRALALDSTGGLWIGTQGGGLSHLAADHHTWSSFTLKSTNGGLASDTVLALLPDDAGGLWIGTGNGLSYLRWTVPRPFSWSDIIN